MVQIMNGSGHCSRNRAERASLDGKPEYPDGTSSAPNQISDISPTTLLQTPDASETVEDEEYDSHSRHGTQGSILWNGEETNNNLSDSEKEWAFIVADPWAATSSFVTPHFDDEDEPQINDDPLKPDNLEKPTSSVTQLASNVQIFESSLPTDSKRPTKTKRRRRKSRGSSSGGSSISWRSTKSLQAPRSKPSHIETRRRSTQSTCGSAKTNMELDSTHVSEIFAGDNLESKHPSGIDPVDSKAEVPSTSVAAPYCYRCYIKFPKYSHWKKHAIYEHILAKNPYPIVEMNYISPASLGILATPSTEEVDRSTLDEENALIDETTSTPEGGTTSDSANHGRLRLCIGKEKGGAYVVKENKSYSQNTFDDSSPPILEASSPNPTSSFKDPSSPDLIMPLLKPCPALTNPSKQYQIIQPKLSQAPNITSGFSNTPPPLLCQSADLEARYRRMVSIESELETVLNIGMEEDFETALEVATERSRVANSISGGIGGSGGVVVPFTSISDPFSSSTAMISEEVPHISPTRPIVSSEEIQPLGKSTAGQVAQEEDARTDEGSLLNRLLNRRSSSEIPSLVKENKSDNSSSDVGKDSELSEDNEVTEGKSDGSCDIVVNIQPNYEKDEQRCQSNTEILKIVEDNTEKSDTDKDTSPVNDREDAENSQSTQIHKESDGDDDDRDGESDALECRVCKKMFLSDDELNAHFSQDHFRLAGGMGILEPESPYPPPQTPQQHSIFLADDDEPTTEPSVRSQTTAAPPSHQAQIRAFAVNAPTTNLVRNGPPNVSLPQHNSTLIRRLSNDSGLVLHHPSSYNGQEELQNIMWRNQSNAAAALNAVAHAQQQRTQGSVSRGFPTMNTNPLHPGNLRPLGSSHRMSPPNMTGGMSTRTHGHPNQQSMSRQPQQQSQIHFSNSSAGSGPQYSMRGPVPHPNQPQRLPIQGTQAIHRASPPQYPTSLHNALTGMGTAPHYSSASSSIRPGGNMVQQQLQQSSNNNRAPQPGSPMRQMHPNPYQQQQQQNALRGIHSTVRPQPGQLGQTIGMNQQMLNQMNAQRELNSQFQQRLAQPQPSMPRLQQSPQQRPAPPYPHQQQQQYRPSPLSQKRPAPDMSMSCIEINEVRPNKEPRMETSHLQTQQLQQSRQVVRTSENTRPPAPNTSSTNSSPGPINQNVAAAIGSVGNAGINSVRLGNSITLSVCPTSSANNSPTTSPALREEHPPISAKQSMPTGSPSAPVSPATSHQMSSVLAVRGVTVTRASPPITAISPVSSPSPCNSPVTTSASPGAHQQIHHHYQHPQAAAASVIQRGPGSISPENPRDRNFSPPVITTVRGNVHPVNNSNSHSSSHNFAVPRPPPPIHRGMGQGVPHQLQHSPSYAINSSADRPERPPTVDLTDDNAQAHYNPQTQQRINGIVTQNQQNPSIRRFVTAQTANFGQTSGQQTRPLTARLNCPSCNICSLMFPSIQLLEQHKLTQHNVPRTNPQQQVPTSTSPGGGATRPQMPPPVGQAQLSHPSASTVRNAGPSRPPLNPGHVAHHRPPLAPGPNSILQHQQSEPSQMQIRSQSPNRPTIPNSPNQNQGKYLYIPLLDLGRLDANKMRKLEEIGISCVVPLQGNNAMTSMGIPVMSLRGEGISSQNVPWDSVLPMGPVTNSLMGPVHFPEAQGSNRGNNPNHSNVNHTRIP